MLPLEYAMSAVAQTLDHLAYVDAAFAATVFDTDTRSATLGPVAEPAPGVRTCNPVVTQLDRLEALLSQWIASNDAWHESSRLPVRRLRSTVCAPSTATSCDRDQAAEDGYFNSVAQLLVAEC